jgi:pyridoxal 5'-phosphate synthase pdxS subunit
MAEMNGNYPTGLRLKLGLAEMLKGGVIMDVMSTEQAVIAERAGATAVMALQPDQADYRRGFDPGDG